MEEEIDQEYETQEKADRDVDHELMEQAQDKIKVLTPLTELVSAYLEAKQHIEALEKELEPLKEAEKAIKAEIIKVFKEERPGEFSTRVLGATVSLSVRKTAQIIDEPLVVKQLQDMGLTSYLSTTVNDLFDEPKKLMASGKEKLLDGMAIKETEYISVRANNKEDPRKIVTGEFKKLK